MKAPLKISCVRNFSSIALKGSLVNLRLLWVLKSIFHEFLIVEIFHTATGLSKNKVLRSQQKNIGNASIMLHQHRLSQSGAPNGTSRWIIICSEGLLSPLIFFSELWRLAFVTENSITRFVFGEVKMYFGYRKTLAIDYYTIFRKEIAARKFGKCMDKKP